MENWKNRARESGALEESRNGFSTENDVNVDSVDESTHIISIPSTHL